MCPSNSIPRTLAERSLRHALPPGHASRGVPEVPHVGIVTERACVGSGDGESRRGARGGRWVGCKTERPRIRFEFGTQGIGELTTTAIRQRRCSFFLALALHDTCADARRVVAGALAGLEDVVVFALSNWDGHAGIACGVCGFADLGRLRIFELVFLGSRLLSFEPVEHIEGERTLGWSDG
jgi:hypothetical protein